MTWHQSPLWPGAGFLLQPVYPLLPPPTSPAMVHISFLAIRHCFQLFWCSTPLYFCTFYCFFFLPLECPSFSWLSFRTISKCSVLPWLPIKSSSANSVLCMVEFLPYYTVVWLFISTCTIICAGTFIRQLFTEWPLCKTPYIVLWIQQ